MSLSAKRPAGVIFGAPRSGTTSLWRYLVQHPDIAASRVKELDFFKRPGAEDYDTAFAADGSVTLEASPAYFREHEDILPRLAESLPDARLICVLREPAARLVAYFRGERDWTGRVVSGVSFADYAQIVARDCDPAPINPGDPVAAQYVKDGSKVGIYADILEEYLDQYAADQILVLFLDDLKSAPQAVVEQCCRHLGVDPERLPEIDFRAENQGVNIRNVGLFRTLRRINLALEPLFNRAPWLRNSLKKLHNAVNGAPRDLHAESEQRGREILQPFYAPHNRRFAKLMRERFGRSALPGWLEGEKT